MADRYIEVGGYRYKLDRQWRRHAEAIRRLHHARLHFLRVVAPDVDEARRKGEIPPASGRGRKTMTRMVLLAAIIGGGACNSPSTQPDCRPQKDYTAVVESRQISRPGANVVRSIMTTEGESIVVRDEELFTKLKPGTALRVDCQPRGRWDLIPLEAPDA